MRHHLALAALGAAATATALPLTVSGPWARVLMQDAATKDGAVSLDGSPGAYYVKWGSGAHVNDWIIHINGGGWCTDPADCYARSLTTLGSSKEFSPTSDFGGFDLLNTSCVTNPDFCTHTVAFIMYTDGGSLAGDAAEPLPFNGTQLYFRGFRILKAVFESLLQPAPPPGGGPSLAAATSVVLTGNSAGGLATILHADTVAGWLTPGTPFRALAQVGFFINGASFAGGNGYTPLYKNVAAMQNVTGSGQQVNAACVAALPPHMHWQCFMAQTTYPFVKSPLFIQNSRLDNWQLGRILSANVSSCALGSCPFVVAPGMDACGRAPGMPPGGACTADQFAAFNAYGAQFMAALNSSLVTNPNAYNGVNGGLITACDLHDHMIGGGWNKITVGGRTMREIVTPWLLGKAPGEWVIDVDWPLNPTCNGPL